MNEKDNCLYFDMSKRERDSAIRYLLGAIIKCRNEGGFPSNYYTFDEDVNVYLAHLLFAISLPEYHEMAEPYLSEESSQIMNWIHDTEDQTIRYFIFKVNADHILVHTAVFDDLAGKHPQAFFKRSKKYYRELAKLYYEQAASYHKRIYKKRTGVGDVLQKMASYFEAYEGVLKQVRKEYFQFMNSFRDQVFHCFMEEMKSYENEFLKKSKMDQFLDLYGRWLDSKDLSLARQVERLASELKGLDPSFRFDVVHRFRREGGAADERKCA